MAVHSTFTAFSRILTKCRHIALKDKMPSWNRPAPNVEDVAEIRMDQSERRRVGAVGHLGTAIL
jgi:hypothetical protein